MPKKLDKSGAPVVWYFQSRHQCFGLHVDDKTCWLGDETGNVYALDHQAKLKRQLKLSRSVKALVGDGQWLYAAAEGEVYDLSGKTPRLAYTVTSESPVLWMDISDGALFASDEGGGLAAFDHEGDSMWRKKSPGDTAWMIRVDEIAAFHGYDGGVTAYARDTGKKLWAAKVKGCTWFGAQTATTAYACTNDDLIYAFEKESGKQRAMMKCEASVNACVATADGKRVYASDSDNELYAFDKKGKRLWKLTLPDAALSLQLVGQRLYGSAQDGGLMCIDVSDEAVAKAQLGTRPKLKNVKAPTDVKVAKTDALEKASAKDVAGGGVLLECVKQGSKLRIKVLSAGYKKDWHVQFPRNLRVVGARFLVEKVVESAGGKFYRTLGEIRRVE